MHKIFWICLLPGLVSCVAPSLAPPKIIGEGSWHEDRDMLGVFSYLKVDVVNKEKTYISTIENLPKGSYSYGFGAKEKKCSSQSSSFLRVDVKSGVNEDRKLFEGDPFKKMNFANPVNHVEFFVHEGGRPGCDGEG